jgi:hypothetical protein
LPPSLSSSPFKKLSECQDRQCIRKIVNDYLTSLITGKEISVKDELEDENDEKVVANSYLFTEELIRSALVNELDLDAIYEDLEYRLGDAHPILLFLRQVMEGS